MKPTASLIIWVKEPIYALTEQIKYYGSNYENSPDFEAATARIQGKIKMYYEEHHEEIDEYSSCDYIPKLIKLKDFIGYLPQ